MKFLKKLTLIETIILVFVILIIVGTFIFLIINRPIQVYEYTTIFTVDYYKSGFDLNNTALTFGMVQPTSSASRKINMKNDYAFAVKMKILISKNMAPYISTPNSTIIVGPFENKTVAFGVYVPEGMKEGNYTGKIRIEVRKYNT